MLNTLHRVTVTTPDVPHITIWGKCHSISDSEQEGENSREPFPTPHLCMLFFQRLAIVAYASVHFLVRKLINKLK